jgi:hypothetical protein
MPRKTGVQPMHLSAFCLSFVVLSFLPAQDQKQAYQGLRCAYLGRWGSFHLIGNGGSAAYALGGDRYVADLEFTDQDANHWYYSPTHGDPLTTSWAFARQKDCNGMYAVWRLAGGRWCFYENTQGWGDGLDRRLTAVPTYGLTTEQQLLILKERVDKHQDILNKHEEKLKNVK